MEVEFGLAHHLQNEMISILVTANRNALWLQGEWFRVMKTIKLFQAGWIAHTPGQFQ